MDIKIVFKENGKIFVNGKEYEKEDFLFNLSGGTLTVSGYQKRKFRKSKKVVIRNNSFSIVDYR